MAEPDKDNKPRVVVGGTNKKVVVFKWAKRLIIVLIVAGLGYVGYTYMQNLHKTGNCAKRTNEECLLLKEAVPLLDPTKVQEFSKTVAKIKQLKTYKKDSNLLYVTEIFYINMSDAANARKNLDLLKKAYKPDVGFDKVIGQNTQSIVVLEGTIKYLEDSQKSAEYNFYGVSSNGTVHRVGQKP